MDTYDLAVVGGGPGGLATAMYGKMRGLSTVVFEAEAFGGQLINLYPTKPVTNFPAQPQLASGELARGQLRLRREVSYRLRGVEVDELPAEGLGLEDHGREPAHLPVHRRRETPRSATDDGKIIGIHGFPLSTITGLNASCYNHTRDSLRLPIGGVSGSVGTRAQMSALPHVADVTVRPSWRSHSHCPEIRHPSATNVNAVSRREAAAPRFSPWIGSCAAPRFQWLEVRYSCTRSSMPGRFSLRPSPAKEAKAHGVSPYLNAVTISAPSAPTMTVSSTRMPQGPV